MIFQIWSWKSGKFWKKRSKCWGDPAEHIASCAALSVLCFYFCLISSHLLNPVLTVQWQKLHSGSDLSVDTSKNSHHSSRQSQSVCAVSIDAQTFSGFPPPNRTDFIDFILHSLTYTHVYYYFMAQFTGLMWAKLELVCILQISSYLASHTPMYIIISCHSLLGWCGPS